MLGAFYLDKKNGCADFKVFGIQEYYNWKAGNCFTVVMIEDYLIQEY